MKTNGWKKAVCMMGICIAILSGTAAKAQNGYVTNDVVENEKVISRIIYRNDGGLENHMKYDFTYDEQNRILSKEIFKWDRRKQCWSPDTKLSFRYTDTHIVMEQARWSPTQNAYSMDLKRAVYEMNEEHMPIAQLIHRKCDREHRRAILEEPSVSWI